MQGFRGLTQIGASRLLAPHCNNQYINQQRRWIVATQNGARLHSQWNRLRQNDAAAMLPPLNACGARESGRRYGRFAIEPQSRAGALQMNSTGQPVPRIAPIAPDQWSPEASAAPAAFPGPEERRGGEEGVGSCRSRLRPR